MKSRRVIPSLSLILLLLFLISELNTLSYSNIPLPLDMAVNKEITTLWNISPTGIAALYEARNFPNSYWLDDNAKFIESIAQYWQSYSSYVRDILQFLEQGDINGYFIKRFEYPLSNFSESFSHGLISYTNGYYYFTFNASDPSQGIRVSTYYNPTLTVAYLQSVVIQEPNGVFVNPCQEIENPISDGGFNKEDSSWRGLLITKWANDTCVTPLNNATTYLNLTESSLFGTQSEQLQYNLPIVNCLSQPIILVKGTKYLGQYNPKGQFVDFNITIYVNSSSINELYLLLLWNNGSVQLQGAHISQKNTTLAKKLVMTVMPVHLKANGKWQVITIPIPNSMYPKYVANSSAYLNAIGFYIPSSSRTGNTGVYIASISATYPTIHPVSFNVIKTENYIAFNYSFIDNSGNEYWWAYLLQKNNLIQVLVKIPENSTLYLGFNGLDTIGPGYKNMYTQKFGYIKNDQGPFNVSWAYFTNQNFGTWLVLNTSYTPNWIGDYNLLFIFPLANYTQFTKQLGHFGSYLVYYGPPTQIRNTLYIGKGLKTPPGYYHWFQIGYHSNNSTILYGFYFIPSVDWIPCPNEVVKKVLDGPSYWKYAVVGENYYEGEIIYALALLGKYGNNQALSMAKQAWNAYYKELEWSKGQTYTSSLARFILATIVLYNVTNNITYLNALNKSGSWLLQYQSSTRYTTFHISMWYHKDNYVTTVNGYPTYGYIINTTSNMDIGTVTSGKIIRINFFEDLPLNTSYAIRLYNQPYNALLPPTISNDLNVSGIVNTTLYFNGGGRETIANITIAIQIANSKNVLQTIGSKTFTNVNIPSGGSNGTPPFYPISFSIPVLTTVNAPPTSTLIVQISINATHKVYMLVDSTNGPSNISIPLTWPNPFYGLFTIPKITNPMIEYPQPNYYLDITALGGQALMALYTVTKNTTYLLHALIIQQGIHYSEEPLLWNDTAGVSIPYHYRIWIYSTYSSIQSDYYTYVDELLLQYANSIGNQTLASLAISRMWERTSLYYPNFMAYNVSSTASGSEINSETQSWGIAAECNFIKSWDYSKIQLFYADFTDGSYLENQTWNGSSLILYVYSSNSQNVSMYFITNFTSFNVIVNGQESYYNTTQNVLHLKANLKEGQNIIVLIPTSTTSNQVKSMPFNWIYTVGIVTILVILIYLITKMKKKAK